MQRIIFELTCELTFKNCIAVSEAQVASTTAQAVTGYFYFYIEFQNIIRNETVSCEINTKAASFGQLELHIEKLMFEDTC